MEKVKFFEWFRVRTDELSIKSAAKFIARESHGSVSTYEKVLSGETDNPTCETMRRIYRATGRQVCPESLLERDFGKLRE